MLSDSDRCLSCPVCLSVCNVGVLWPNGCMDQDETISMDRGLGPDHIVLDGDPDPPKGHNPSFGPMSVVAKRLDGLRCHMLWR